MGRGHGYSGSRRSFGTSSGSCSNGGRSSIQLNVNSEIKKADAEIKETEVSSEQEPTSKQKQSNANHCSYPLKEYANILLSFAVLILLIFITAYFSSVILRHKSG